MGFSAFTGPPFVDSALSDAAGWWEMHGHFLFELRERHVIQAGEYEGAQLIIGVNPCGPSWTMRAAVIASRFNSMVNGRFNRDFNVVFNGTVKGGFRPIYSAARGAQLRQGNLHVIRRAGHVTRSRPRACRPFSSLRTVTSDTRRVRAISATL